MYSKTTLSPLRGMDESRPTIELDGLTVTTTIPAHNGRDIDHRKRVSFETEHAARRHYFHEIVSLSGEGGRWSAPKRYAPGANFGTLIDDAGHDIACPV